MSGKSRRVAQLHRQVVTTDTARSVQLHASLFINDDESRPHHDYEVWLERLAPHEPVSRYRHNRTGEDNGYAHLKRQIMGREVVVAVTEGRLDFGPRGGWTSGRGSGYSTASSTAGGGSGRW